MNKQVKKVHETQVTYSLEYAARYSNTTTLKRTIVNAWHLWGSSIPIIEIVSRTTPRLSKENVEKLVYSCHDYALLKFLKSKEAEFMCMGISSG